MGGIHLAFEWLLLGPETACAQAASFAATTALEASSARVVFARLFTHPPDFSASMVLSRVHPFHQTGGPRIAACPPAHAYAWAGLKTTRNALLPDFPHRATSIPATPFLRLTQPSVRAG